MERAGERREWERITQGLSPKYYDERQGRLCTKQGYQRGVRGGEESYWHCGIEPVLLITYPWGPLIGRVALRAGMFRTHLRLGAVADWLCHCSVDHGYHDDAEIDTQGVDHAEAQEHEKCEVKTSGATLC